MKFSPFGGNLSMEKQAEIQISYVELEAGFLCYLYLQKPDKKGI